MSDEWVETTLGEVADFQVGQAFKSSVFRTAKDGVRLLRGMNLGPGTTRWEETYLWPETGAPQFPRYLLEPGDVCIAMDATFTSDGRLRAASVTQPDLPALLVQRVARLRAGKDSPAVSAFIALLVQGTRFREHLLARQTGAFAPHVSGQDIQSFSFPLPPLPVQRRIVDLVGHLDNHLANLRAERDAAETSRVAALEQWIASAGGTVARLGDLLSIARGGSPRPIDDYFTEDENGLNWIKIGDVPPGGRYITSTAQKIKREGLSKTRQVKVGDFLLSNSMSFGRPYILRIDGCIHDGWLVLANVEDSFNPDYLYHLLRSRGIQQQFASLAAGSGVKNLNIKVVESVEVSVPPLPVQNDVAVALTEWSDLIDVFDREIVAGSQSRSALLTALLTREVEIPDSYDELLAEAS